MKPLLLLLSLVCAASLAFAAEGVTITPMGDAYAKDYQGEESFEFSMPPAGWYRDTTNSGCAAKFVRKTSFPSCGPGGTSVSAVTVISNSTPGFFSTIETSRKGSVQS